MLNKPITRRSLLGLGAAGAASLMFAGCTSERADGKIEVEIVSYKQEAVSIFEHLMEEFNAAHDDIYLNITSPADAVTVMKTRFVRENYPDVIGIGGDADYASFVDSSILADVSDCPTMDSVSPAYSDILKSVTYVPMDGIYGVPYVANAAGMLYNKDLFEEHGWTIPETWDELIALFEQIQSETPDIYPIYLGYLDTWTILSPWNSITINMVPSDLARQVNAGKAKFADYYREPAERMLQLLDYAEDGPFAYSYNDACTAFARGQSAMYPCGSFAVPQILSVNPDMNIGMFAMPSADNPDDRIVVSGVDLQWCVAETCEHKDAVYEVIAFLNEQENVQTYIDDQRAIPCTEGDFTLDPLFDDIQEFLDEGRVLDYLDHSYQSAMACDAQLQTMLLNGDIDAFLTKWDEDWQRYNRSVIRKVQDYESQQ
ncbi:extracellular solute-binding protein [Collinsella tanakaei]|uniref:ABC transporter substrate-binding protein n=1 Tax=Collinsella ihumii TaxID=1720204 RepID=UPI00195B614B|nr:extracellular solute-binding protein [Collinsella ihumii]MBM6786126.1 extracellular solute-binding protein [Collinsella tanakaei]MBM6905346.1 extracellular solute-binding protein [Collinsella tanakaei]MCF6413032.1 extracellular solute-binding protein [Collinsella tanakaei]MDN0055334.1 extracellular solute-binding protein [Collinsella ihumii]